MKDSPARTRAKELAKRARSQGDALSWFDRLYSEANLDRDNIPWAHGTPNPLLVEWFEDRRAAWKGKKALQVGCGLGDDAEYLSAQGMKVTAFDVSQAAIAWCKERYPESTVDYRVADLLRPPKDWAGAFDLVVESYTLQALPSEERLQAIAVLPAFVSVTGMLLVICRGCDADDPEGDIPWPLTKEEIHLLENNRLTLSEFEDFIDGETPPIRRFRAVLSRRTPSSPMPPNREAAAP